MSEFQWLSWIRGVGLQSAVAIFCMGIVWRTMEIYTLGRKLDIAEPRRISGASGWHTIYRRFLAPLGMIHLDPVTYIGGYVFHLGLLIVFFLSEPHIHLIRELIGLSWPALPPSMIDIVTIVTLITMIVVLVDRVRKPLKRFLSGFGDYVLWVITFLPVLSGYLTVHHLLLPYTILLALHMISVEVLLIVFPFTKLFHAVTVWPSRWFNGNTNARKGVPV